MRAKQKAGRIILIILMMLVILAVCAAGTVYYLYKQQNPIIIALKDELKIFLCDIKMDKLSDKTEGLGVIDKTAETDGMEILYSGDTIRLVNYADGYYFDFPKDTVFGFANAPLYVTADSDNYTALISREYSTEDDVAGFCSHYIYGFLLDEGWRQANRVELIEDRAENNKRIITARVSGLQAGIADTYTYVSVETDTKIFVYMMFKYEYADYEQVMPQIQKGLDEFRYFRPSGEAKYGDSATAHKPYLENVNWSDETRAVYDDIVNSDSVRWGLFTDDVYETGIKEKIPELEQALDYSFPVILSYMHFGDALPVEFMEENYRNGRLVELTYQLTSSNNENLTGYTPMLDIYRGEKDEDIRQLARAVKRFGHPFLFRLNNEMNSDWTSYSGVVNMCDPEIYISVWQRIYNIFAEESVDNAIWIYNPNDKGFPPCKWNNFLSYYPGDGYVQMIGVTGYNTGTYYKEKNNEQWREFKNIYDSVEKEYAEFFDGYPWIITEFASSSHGGDKAKWIDNMFRDINHYKNIKIAVWFSSADYDPDYPNNTVVSRPYWLDETAETLQAMADGLKKAGRQSWSFE